MNEQPSELPNASLEAEAAYHSSCGWTVSVAVVRIGRQNRRSRLRPSEGSNAKYPHGRLTSGEA
jgi:hypothetical protein